MSIRTVIVEDELHSLKRMRSLLSDFEELTVVGEATDGLAAQELIDELKPDLVFLDIQMPGANGFEVLARIHARPMVIFVTAYDEYAIKAFDENAVDYILKPTSRERVEKAIRRVLERRAVLAQDLIERLRSEVARGSYMKRFAVNLADEILIIPESEVFYFKAEEKCVLLGTQDREFFFEMTLKDLERNLDPEVFARIHKSHIISLDKVKKIHRWFHGDYIIHLSDGRRSKLKVGRSYREALREKLKW